MIIHQEMTDGSARNVIVHKEIDGSVYLEIAIHASGKRGKMTSCASVYLSPNDVGDLFRALNVS
jgi:hypothetical protein